MPIEQKSRTGLKRVLACIAIALLGIQLLTMIGQQGGGSVAGPTQVSESTEVNASQTACTDTVKVRVLNQRSGPGESYSITGSANNGEVFTVNSWDGTQQWIRVTTSYGSAWMYARYMTLSGNCSNLPVYSPTSTPELVGQAVTSTPEPGTTSTLSSVFTAEVQYFAPKINAWAAAYQMDPNLIATVIQIESCGNPSIHSTAGAQGLFQVMPIHFTAGEDMLDVETNARRGLEYLQGALKLAQGNVALALAGYNGGYGVMNGRWAVETQRYSYWGSHIYSEAISGLTTSATLQQWLSAGGASLCTQASKIQQLMD